MTISQKTKKPSPCTDRISLLTEWQQWQTQPPLAATPRIIRALGTGLNNASFLVQGGHQFFALRQSDNHKTLTPPEQEYALLQQAAQQGIAPTPRFFSASRGILVCDYLTPDATAQSPAAIADLLRQLHTLPALSQVLNLNDSIDYYRQQLDDSILRTLTSEHERAINLLSDLDSDAPLVPCHCDLLHANRLSHQGKLYAIDFEYAAMAPRWYDLAVIIEGDHLSTAQANALIFQYLQRAPRPDESAAIARYRGLYRYIETLWMLCY